jgi:toxin ParE1/3/4
MRVRWTPEAAEDLDSIHDYIAQYNPAAALQVSRQLYRGIAQLAEFPRRGRPGLKHSTRELVFTPLPYIAVYRIKESTVEVLRIWHTARHRSS